MKCIVYWLFFLILVSNNIRAGEKKKVDFKNRHLRISREIEQKSSSHGWAGIYDRGTSLTGQTGYLALAPKNGFVFHAASSCSSATDQNYGEVQQKGKILLLSPKLKYRGDQKLCLDSKLHIVTWGKTRYLIEEKDLVRFCNAVNSGLEYPFPLRLSEFLTWSGSNKKAVEGLPVVPEKYQPFILKKPISAKVTKIVGSKQDTSLIATLDVGANRGVFLGMEWYSTKSTSVSKGAFKGIVTEVGKANCKVKMLEFLENKTTIQVGQELSTVLIDKRFNIENNKASSATLKGYKRTEL